jgi:hypothetical protein
MLLADAEEMASAPPHPHDLREDYPLVLACHLLEPRQSREHRPWAA